MTFDAIKQAIKGYANLSSTEADTRIGEAVNRHYRRITASLGLDVTRFVTRSRTTTLGEQAVTFDEIEKIDRLIDTTDATAIRLLKEVGIHQQRSAQPGDGQPSTWAVQTSDADTVTVLLDTVPQTTYSLQADGTTTLADLQGSDAPAFPESFHDILVWSVLEEELLKKEKVTLAETYRAKAEQLLSDLRFVLADSPTRETKQGATSLTGGAANSSGGGTVGGASYTQSGLVTFDRGAGLAPFAVAQATAATVTNLDADKLDGLDSTEIISTAATDGTTAAIAAVEAGSAPHHTTHQQGGLDPIKLDDLATPDDNTDLNATTGRHGLLPKLSGTATQFLNGAGTFSNPIAGNNTEVLFNDLGGLGADSGMTYNKVTDTLTIPHIDLGTGGQIIFPGAQNASTNANTLDDYEEGTWSPVIGGSGGTSGQSYSNQEGRYIKIGSFVWASCYVRLSAKGTITGNVQVQGLPFTAENGIEQFYGGSITWENTANSFVNLRAYVVQNTTAATIFGINAASTNSIGTNLAAADIANNTAFITLLIYRAST